MSAKSYDELETRLTELFDRQARAFPESKREWSDNPVSSVKALDEQRKRRRARTTFGAVGALAAAVAVVVGVMNFNQSGGRVSVKPQVQGQPFGRPVLWQSENDLVRFKADDFIIEANGKTFTAQNTPVAVDSDPGSADYWTLEVTWQEHGVEMRMFIYFASDGRDWWATEIRTYDGQTKGDWIEYHGAYFKSPLGRPFVGDLDLVDKATGSTLHVHGLRLETHPKKFDCTVGSGTYAIVLEYRGSAIELSPGTSAIETALLLDRAACATVPQPDRYTLTWSSTDPSVATVAPADCTGMGPAPGPALADACRRGEVPSYTGVKAGQTTFHAVAKDRNTGAVVGQRDFPVTVAG
ncbi:MAG: hypothetical protein M3Q30_25760 [Actinomycetota bacterium]|nr:hypothetical protein [Actinomycetota bacterium]